MTVAATKDWQSLNQARLTGALSDLKAVLRRQAEQSGVPANSDNHSRYFSEPDPTPIPDLSTGAGGRCVGEDGIADDATPPALQVLCSAFSLSRFERSLLLLCAGIELDSTFAPLCAAAQGDPNRPYPTFSLGLAALPEAHWSALTPDAPLRRWRLVEVDSGTVLTTARLRVDERVLHYLAGVSHLDERLAGLVELIPAITAGDLAPSHAAVSHAIVAAWSARQERGRIPVAQLCGTDLTECRLVAAAAAAAVGLRAVALPSDLIPAAAAELEALLRLWERESALGGGVLIVEGDLEPTLAGDDSRSRAAGRFVERLAGPVLVSCREPWRVVHRPVIRFDLSHPTTVEQRAAWRAALPSTADSVLGALDTVASQFNLSLSTIRSVATESRARVEGSPASDMAGLAWQACRARCRTRLDGLAQRIEPAAGWDDLVLPEPQVQGLRQIAAHVRHRATVYETWGFAARSSRGLGIAALFSGPSGTGKTMAAEVLALELRLDLYRIDLASVVSKYIGETEKNLRRVFDAAEESGAILLFDEADALFGKRSEVKDSHDRYANIEVSYLLQRMEAYRGLAILTTNLKSALDTAFLRRLRFVVQFPFPDANHRAEIWRRMFPKNAPTEGLDVSKLAKLNIPGGNIRNIALNAAFLAAEAVQPIRMSHALTAARAEYAKLEKPLTDAEIGGWL